MTNIYDLKTNDDFLEKIIDDTIFSIDEPMKRFNEILKDKSRSDSETIIAYLFCNMLTNFGDPIFVLKKMEAIFLTKCHFIAQREEI